MSADAEVLSVGPQPGDRIKERYELGSRLGRGAVGAVFEAKDLKSGARVAIKLLHGSSLLDERSRARFRREARAVAGLHHPGVVGVLGTGTDEAGRPYLVMEMVEGRTLASWRGAPPPLPMLLLTADRVLEALAHAHARGIVHRDLKPENILLSPGDDPMPRITDFGLAHATLTSPNITRPDQRVGSPAYMAPEQAAGGVQGPEVDLYSVGTLLFEVISGRLPFSGTSPIELLVRKLNEPPPPLVPRAGYDLPEGLAQVVFKALARNPQHRYRLAADFRRALRPFLPGTPTRTLELTWTERDEQSGAQDDGVAGRSEERRALLDLASRVVEQRRPGFAVIEADPGLGKTRLLEWLAHRVEESGAMRVLRIDGAETLRRDQGIPDAIAAYIRADPEQDGLADARVATPGLNILPDRADREALQAYLRGEETLSVDERHAVIGRTLRALADRRAVLIAVDDLDAASSFTVGLLEHILVAGRLDPMPVLLVVCKQASGHGDAPPFERVLERARTLGPEVHMVLHLSGLSDEAVRRIGAGQGLGPEALEQLVERSDGHPLFARLLARSLAGTTARDDLPDALGAALHADLEEKLSGCSDPAQARAAITALAVLGLRWPLGLAIRFLRDALDVTDPKALVEELLTAGLLAEPGNLACIDPPLLREVLLDEPASEETRRLHLAAARAKEGWFGRDVGRIGGELARHMRSANHLEEELEFLRLAAIAAERDGRLGEAAAYHRARAKRSPAERAADRARAWLETGRIERARGHLREARTALESLRSEDLPEVAAESALQHSGLAAASGEFRGLDEVIRSAEAAMDLLPAEARDRADSVLRIAKARAALERGRPRTAVTLLAKAMAVKDPELRARRMILEAEARADLGEIDAARLGFEQARSFVDEHPSMRKLLPRILRGNATCLDPRSDVALRLLDQSLEQSRLQGRRRDEAATLLAQASCMRLRDEPAKADELLVRARVLVQQLTAPRETAELARQTAMLHSGDEMGSEARQLLQAAANDAETRGDRRRLRILQVTLARLEADAGSGESARRWAGRAMVGNEPLPVSIDVAQAMETVGKRMADGGLLEEARHALDLARRHYWLLQDAEGEMRTGALLTSLPAGRGRS